jgi:Zn-dependent peptidase ImmA (M78 family)
MATFRQGAISDLETGRTAATPERIRPLAEALGVDPAFAATPAVPVRILRRLQSSLPATTVARLRADLALAHYRVERLLGPADPLAFPHFHDVHAFDAARALRRKWSVPAGPVANMVHLVESHGIVCLRRDISAVRTGVVGSWPEDAHPVVFLGNMTTREVRVDLARELGHAVLRHTPSKQAEIEASDFALEFLLPHEDVRDELNDLTRDRLLVLERGWALPPEFIARRALASRRITATRHRALVADARREGSPNGPARSESPTLLRAAVDRRLADGEGRAQIAADLHLTVPELREQILAGSAGLRRMEPTDLV